MQQKLNSIPLVMATELELAHRGNPVFNDATPASAQMHFSECPSASELFFLHVRCCPAARDSIGTNFRDVRSHPVEFKKKSVLRVSLTVRSSVIFFFENGHPGGEGGILRGHIDAKSLMEPKSLMPDRFGKKNDPSWRTWSYLARDFVGAVHATLKQAMKDAENQKQPIAATNFQHDFGVTNEMDQELQHFLISRTDGEAMEVLRGAEREPSLEQWRRLAALYDP